MADPATSPVAPIEGAGSGGKAPSEPPISTAKQMARWLNLMDAQLRRAYLELTRTLVATVEAKDRFTERHTSRVARYSADIATRMGLSAAEVACVETAAVLHDIGKIGVPDAILNKPGPLTRTEFDIIRRHPRTAIEILGHTTFLDRELPLILHHHERYDGAGYPAGLTGRQIPLGARILNVADSLDAMLSRRSYKAPLTVPRARTELVVCAGRQFDPAVVDAALAWLDESGDRVLAGAAT